jgi:hypothetical protein
MTSSLMVDEFEALLIKIGKCLEKTLTAHLTSTNIVEREYVETVKADVLLAGKIECGVGMDFM